MGIGDPVPVQFERLRRMLAEVSPQVLSEVHGCEHGQRSKRRLYHGWPHTSRGREPVSGGYRGARFIGGGSDLDRTTSSCRYVEVHRGERCDDRYRRRGLHQYIGNCGRGSWPREKRPCGRSQGYRQGELRADLPIACRIRAPGEETGNDKPPGASACDAFELANLGGNLCHGGNRRERIPSKNLPNRGNRRRCGGHGQVPLSRDGTERDQGHLTTRTLGRRHLASDSARKVACPARRDRVARATWWAGLNDVASTVATGPVPRMRIFTRAIVSAYSDRRIHMSVDAATEKAPPRDGRWTVEMVEARVGDGVSRWG